MLEIICFDKYTKPEIDERIVSLLNAEPYTYEVLETIECDNMFSGLEVERIVSSIAFSDLFGRDYDECDKMSLSKFLEDYQSHNKTWLNVNSWGNPKNRIKYNYKRQKLNCRLFCYRIEIS